MKITKEFPEIDHTLSTWLKRADILNGKEPPKINSTGVPNVKISEEYLRIPTKSDGALDYKHPQKEIAIYDADNPNAGYFKYIRDHEKGNHSIHFVTDRNVLTPQSKEAMFDLLYKIIPKGDNVSTWGYLSEGGISGIMRFAKDPRFKQIGTRKVYLKDPNSLEFISNKYGLSINKDGSLNLPIF